MPIIVKCLNAVSKIPNTRQSSELHRAQNYDRIIGDIKILFYHRRRHCSSVCRRSSVARRVSDSARARNTVSVLDGNGRVDSLVKPRHAGSKCAVV